MKCPTYPKIKTVGLSAGVKSWLQTIRLVAFSLACGVGFLMFCGVSLMVILYPEQYVHVSYDTHRPEAIPIMVGVPSPEMTPKGSGDNNADGAAMGCGLAAVAGRFVPGAGPYVAATLGAVVGYELDKRL